MGLFDKLKSAASAVTGGAATVTVDAPAVMRGEPATVMIRATAKGALKFDDVYLLIRCREEADLKDTDLEGGKVEREIVRGRATVYTDKVSLGQAQTLEEGESTSLSADFTIPESANPSVRGRMIRCIWEIKAGLDAFGNDPDSGWREIQVR